MVRNTSAPPAPIRYVLGNNETPNQPVSVFLTKEFVRLKQLAGEPMDCSICLESICCVRCCVVLQCGHWGHFLCLQKQLICPLCRA